MKRIQMKQALSGLATYGLAMASVGLLLVSACPVAQASPQLGGDCHYCHSEEQSEALAITGFDEILDDHKVFDVLPGGSVELGIDVDNSQAPDPAYRTVLRGLDRLNGSDSHGTPQGFPLLYTPDPSWDTKGPAPGNLQYLFWEGQFYGAPGGRTYDPMDYDFLLEISPEVKPGLYEVIDNDPDPDVESFGRGYLIVDGLSLLNVDAGPPPAYEDIPYTPSKYTANVGTDPGQWHDERNGARYMGLNGQYYAQSSTDPAASMPFPLELDADVAPGPYALTAKLARGRPSDPSFLNGWTVAKYFYLEVLPASVTVPEPGTLLLLACALPAVWLRARRRRR